MPYCEIKGELLLSEQRIYFAADEREYSNLIVSKKINLNHMELSGLYNITLHII
jgi:hypothetical protein